MIVLGIDPGTARLGYGVVDRAGSNLTMVGNSECKRRAAVTSTPFLQRDCPITGKFPFRDEVLLRHERLKVLQPAVVDSKAPDFSGMDFFASDRIDPPVENMSVIKSLDSMLYHLVGKSSLVDSLGGYGSGTADLFA